MKKSPSSLVHSLFSRMSSRHFMSAILCSTRRYSLKSRTKLPQLFLMAASCSGAKGSCQLLVWKKRPYRIPRSFLIFCRISACARVNSLFSMLVLMAAIHSGSSLTPSICSRCVMEIGKKTISIRWRNPERKSSLMNGLLNRSILAAGCEKQSRFCQVCCDWLYRWVARNGVVDCCCNKKYKI